MPFPSKDFSAKFTTGIAGGDLPDLMYLNDPNLLYDYYSKGIYLQLDKEYDTMPNLKKQLEKYPSFYKDFRMADGHYYTFPFIAEVSGSKGIMISTDWAEKAGIDPAEVKTLDDWTSMLTSLKKALGGKAPWVGRKKINNIDFITPLFGTGRSFYYNTENKTYQFGPADENYRLMVETLAKWYKDGLIHKDFFTMDPETYEAGIGKEEFAFAVEALSNGLLSSKADPDKKPWSLVLPPVINGKTYYAMIQEPNVRSDSVWTVSAKTKALEEIKKLADWAYSKEGVDTLSFGVEGRDFVRMDNGDPTFQLPGMSLEEALDRAKKIKKDYSIGFFRNIFVLPATIDGNPWANTYEADGRKYYTDNNAYGPAAPGLVFTKEELEQRKVLETPINTYVDEQLVKFITGIRPVGEYQKFLDEVKSMGYEDNLKIYDEAFERYNK